MKKSLVLVAAVLLFVVFCGSLNSENKSKPIEEKFFDYVTSKGRSYKELKEYQEDYEYHLRSGHMLSMAWFYKGEIRIAMIFMLDNFGNYVLVKNLFEWEKKTIKKGKLTPEKLQQIKDEMKKIKEVKAAPKIGNEYYISYRKGLRWNSTCFDIVKLPKYVENIIAIADIAEK